MTYRDQDFDMYMDGTEAPDSFEENKDEPTPKRRSHLRLVHSDGGPPSNHNPWLASLPCGTVFLAKPKGRNNPGYGTNLIPYEVKYHFERATLLRVCHPDDREWYSYEDTQLFSNVWELFEVIYEPKRQENEDQSNWSDRPSDVEHSDHVET